MAVKGWPSSGAPGMRRVLPRPCAACWLPFPPPHHRKGDIFFPPTKEGKIPFLEIGLNSPSAVLRLFHRPAPCGPVPPPLRPPVAHAGSPSLLPGSCVCLLRSPLEYAHRLPLALAASARRAPPSAL